MDIELNQDSMQEDPSKQSKLEHKSSDDKNTLQKNSIEAAAAQDNSAKGQPEAGAQAMQQSNSLR